MLFHIPISIRIFMRKKELSTSPVTVPIRKLLPGHLQTIKNLQLNKSNERQFIQRIMVGGHPWQIVPRPLFQNN
jgi:hypothetical protein